MYQMKAEPMRAASFVQVDLPQRQADLLTQIAKSRRFELVQASRRMSGLTGGSSLIG